MAKALHKTSMREVRKRRLTILGSEVNAVIKALRQNGIEVTAIHSHMLMEEPRLFLMHFWASDDAVKLRGLRAALDRTNSAK